MIIVQKLTLPVVVSMSLFSTFSHAKGVGSTGGGNAVVCLRADKSIMSAELLDLYEARTLHNWTIRNSTGTPAARAALAVDQLSKDNFLTKQIDILSLTKTVRFLPLGSGLVPILDSDNIETMQPNCSLVQLARYENNGDIYVNSDIWSHLNDTNRAALYAHEAVYAELRIFGEINSRRTRLAVGAAFSGKDFKSVIDGVPFSAGIETCIAKSKSADVPFAGFISYPDMSGGVSLQFITMDGMPMFSKSTIHLKDAKWPLTQSAQQIFDVQRMDSLIDNGLPVFVQVDNSGANPVAKIGLFENVDSPRFDFECSVSNR